MLVAIIGDIVGSVFEFNNTKSTDFEFYKESKSREEHLKAKHDISREHVYANWQIEDFYRTLAEEEGTTPKDKKMKEIRLLDFTIAGTTFCKEFDKTDGEFIKDGMTIIVKREK